MKSHRSTSVGGKSTTIQALLRALFNRGSPFFESLWSIPDVDSAYSAILRQVLPFHATTGPGESNFTDRWALLPGLSCQAAGGVFIDADPVTFAWLTFYIAAQLMDSVEDADEPHPWWEKIGASGALNTATGLFFCANLLLNRLHEKNIHPEKVSQITNLFNQQLFVMCSGQHFDLTIQQKSLSDYWKIASQKSGGFFALACVTGASLGTLPTEKLDFYNSFGLHLGILIQIMDDLEDWHAVIHHHESQPIVDRISNTLPIIYANEVLPEKELETLNGLISGSREDERRLSDLIELVDDTGASVYILAEMQKQFELAEQALNSTVGEEEATGLLHYLLDSLYPQHLNL
jgi:geranylgeranyl pyrophosphate synthase